MRNGFNIFIFMIILLSACSKVTANPVIMEQQPFRNILNLEKEDIPQDFIPKELKIAAIGDSLTEGVGDSNDEGGYLKYLQDDLSQLKGVKEVVVNNHGVEGNRSTQLLKRLEEEEINHSIKDADIIIITIGGNDIMKIVRENFFNLNLDIFQEGNRNYGNDLNNIFTKVRKGNPDSVILLVGLYNPFSLLFTDIEEFQQILTDWNSTAQEVVAQYDNSYFVDIEDIFATSGLELLYEDLFHPNDKGYELIADKVFDTLTEDVIPSSNDWFVVKEGLNEE